MKTLTDILRPYNFSKTRCHIVRVDVLNQGYTKLECKVPAYVQKLKGIYLSANSLHSGSQCIGYISLSFNGNAFKTFQTMVYQTIHLSDTSNPFPLNEQLERNSFMQGYYYDISNVLGGPYRLSIYLHYEP